MKLYFLVEGISTEMKVLPFWSNLIIPNIPIYPNFSDYQAAERGMFFVSGYGYPSIINHIQNSIADINNNSNTDFFFIIVDCDEDDIDVRKNAINAEIEKSDLPERLSTHIIVQKRCFETILLGNPKAITRNPQTSEFKKYANYYNVIENDPELMGSFTFDHHSKFHFAYLKSAFNERRIRYSKSDPSGIMTEDYLRSLIARTKSTPHLASFRNFIEILFSIENIMNPHRKLENS